MFKLIALAGIALVAATPALAQIVPADQATSAQKPKDPNRIICERDEETGSRLGAKREFARRPPSGTRCVTPTASRWKTGSGS